MSEKLNELKKATMASYLSKAGRRVRTAAKLATDFENDAYKDMATANKHHPNMVTPGFEKDPEKLDRAERSMKANFDLRDTFKRDSDNRIKGIARAGRLLAKEDTLNERNTESHPELWNTHELVHKSGKVLKKGDKVKTSDGTHKIVGFELPHHSGSTGRVFVHDKQAAFKMASYFPSVVDAKIRKKAVKEEVEQINEVSRSTIAKLATARYQQAQKALKDKDFGGYVNKMKKAIKASDATTPNTGWSPEDDKKNEEVVPEISATEKYRQIKEAKVKRILQNYKTGVGMRGYGDPPKGNVDYPNDPRNSKPKKIGEAITQKDMDKVLKGKDIGRKSKDPWLNDTSLDKPKKSNKSVEEK